MISQAAIKDPTGRIWTLPRPNRHGQVISLMLDNNITNFEESVMGFVDENGVFYDRMSARAHAVDVGQPIYVDNPFNPDDRILDNNPSKEYGLASEDVG
jgi:hypothetical protein